MDGCFVTDEWIVDGFYFAVAMHSFQNLIHGPWQLDEPPEEAVQDQPDIERRSFMTDHTVPPIGMRMVKTAAAVLICCWCPWPWTGRICASIPPSRRCCAFSL